MRSWIFLFLIGLCIYGNSLNHPMMIDDHAFFGDMDRRWEHLLYNFIPDKGRFLNIEGEAVEVYYRPLALIIPKMLHLIFGNNVFFYHFISLVLWVTAAWLVLRFLMTLGIASMTATLAACFYLIHPINNIVVNFKTAIIFAVQVIAMLLSMYCMFNIKRYKHQWQAYGQWGLLFLIAVFCHESALALPLFLLTVLFIQKIELKKIVQLIWPCVLMVGVYLIWRLFNASLIDNLFGKWSTFDINIAEFLATQVQLQWWYLSRIFYTEGIVISVFVNPVNQALFVYFVAGATLWGGLLYGIKRVYRQPTYFLCSSWLMIGFLLIMAGSLFHGKSLMIEPHWLVFPSMSIFVFLAEVLVQLFKIRWMLYAAIAALMFMWSVSTISYNNLWNNELRYCLYWQQQSPDFKPINMYIARYFFARGYLDLAQQYYQRALTGSRPDYLMLANLGTIAFLKKDHQQAKNYLLKALAIEPKAYNVLNTLGVMYAQDQDWPNAIKIFQRSIAVNQFNITARINLAKIYKNQGLGDYRAICHDILRVDPNNPHAKAMLMQAP